MTFRDDREAMRARIDELERSLARAEERASEATEERDALRDKIPALEAELAQLRDEPKARARRAEREREAKTEREREAKAEREREAKAQRQEQAAPRGAPGEGGPARWLKILGGVLGAGVLGIGFVSVCAPPTWTASHAAPSLGMIDLDTTPSPPLVYGDASGERSTPWGCAGSIPDAPQLVLRSQEATFVSLGVESTGDTVLVLLSADGSTYCDDDSGGGSNPALGRVLPPGESRVWIGTYSGDGPIPFTLRVTTASAPDGPVDESGLAPSATPVHGVLRPTPSGQPLSGSILPRVSASAIDGRCRGYLEMAPTAVLELEDQRHVRIDTIASDDLVLFVEGPDGTVYCDDDGGPGTAPLIAELFERGRYRVWLGSYASRSTPVAYTLVVRGVPREGREPAPVALAVGQTHAVEAGVPAMRDPRCNTLVGPGVDAVLDLATNVDVEVRGPRAGTVLRVAGPEGIRCLGPGRSAWSRGRHRVNVALDAESQSEGGTTVVLEAFAPTLLPYAP